MPLSGLNSDTQFHKNYPFVKKKDKSNSEIALCGIISVKMFGKLVQHSKAQTQDAVIMNAIHPSEESTFYVTVETNT